MDPIFFQLFFFFAGLLVPTRQPNDWAWSHRRQPRPLCLLSVAAPPCSGTTINNSSSLSSTTSLPSERRPSCLTACHNWQECCKTIPDLCLDQELPSLPRLPSARSLLRGQGPRPYLPPSFIAYRIFFCVWDHSSAEAAGTRASLPGGSGTGVRRRLESRGCWWKGEAAITLLALIYMRLWGCGKRDLS